MRIRVLSDLHLEFQRWTPPPAPADVVVLAGDIHAGAEGIRWGRDHFPDTEIVYVPGNHEYYGAVMTEVQAQLRREARRFGVHLLDANAVEIAGVRFLGATLWTNFELDGRGDAEIARAMALAQTAMSDYSVIRAKHGAPISPDETCALHHLQVDWLAGALATPYAEPTVVVTHHLPHPDSIHAKYRGDPLNACFASDLSTLVRAPVALWIHGHTHESMDYRVNGTRVVCNPRGYLPDEPNPGFKPAWVVELDPGSGDGKLAPARSF
jgi:predicted phosphodiesterase